MTGEGVLPSRPGGGGAWPVAEAHAQRTASGEPRTDLKAQEHSDLVLRNSKT